MRLSTSRRVSRLFALSLALSCAIALAVPALAGAGRGLLHLKKSSPGIAAAPSATEPHWVCPQGACEAIAAPTPVKVGNAFALPGTSVLLEGSGELGGFDPADLKAAYNISTGTEGTPTIAVVDAFGYPNAESDLAAYRSKYGLPQCTKANGCFKKVNEKGEEGKYPAASAEWEGESALDVDMVSAACPECQIMLVEASGEAPSQLAASVNEAVALGANEVSNSYGYPELYEAFCGTNRCESYDASYQHAGVEIFAAAGDQGYADTYYHSKYGLPYQTNFPAAAPSVVAVGGTALYKGGDDTRGWHETVWDEIGRGIGTGAGCTAAQPKPSWQKDTGCTHRIDNDAAAVAAVETGVSVRLDGAWAVYGGTSVSSPLVAGIEAHASSSIRNLGALGFYDDPGSLFDVTEGFAGLSSSECGPAYLCNATVGYDGPTGLGTPDGVPATSAPPAPPTATITAPLPNKTYAVGAKVKTTFACAEGAGGPGLESCTDSTGHSGTSGLLNTAAPGIYTYTVTAKSIDGQTATAQISYAVTVKGYAAYDACLSSRGCGYVFLVDNLAKLWQLPQFEVSGTIQTVAGKPKKTDFLVTSTLSNGCVYTSVKTATSYNSAASQGTFECGGVVQEQWYAFKL